LSESNISRAKRLKKERGKTVKLSSGKQRNIYFTDEVQSLILEYQQTENRILKDRIFNKIYPVFNRVAHNLIYKYKLLTTDISFQDLKAEVVAHLYEKLNKYDPKKGSAFSYFSVITVHFLLARRKEALKDLYSSYEIDTLEMPTSLDLEIYERLSSDEDDITYEKIDNFVEYFQEFITMHFHREDDYIIANAILQLIINSKDLAFPMNNKSVYFLVKEQVGCKQADILRIIRRFKKIYKRVAFKEDLYGQ